MRTSNIELLRIIAMFMIILHHYCNAGAAFMDIENNTINSLLLQFFTGGGQNGGGHLFYHLWIFHDKQYDENS